MTLDEIKKLDREFLIPQDIAPILHCDPHLIRIMARTKPKLLGFPVIVIGTRTKIPRVPFINFLQGNDT